MGGLFTWALGIGHWSSAPASPAPLLPHPPLPNTIDLQRFIPELDAKVFIVIYHCGGNVPHRTGDRKEK